MALSLCMDSESSYPFLRISSFIFDSYDQQLVIVNSIIYSVDPDLVEQNVEILLKHSDNVNCPLLVMKVI
jgi:hypothetical protein